MNRDEILRKCCELAEYCTTRNKYEKLYREYHKAFYRGEPETCACLLDEIEQYMR